MPSISSDTLFPTSWFKATKGSPWCDAASDCGRWVYNLGSEKVGAATSIVMLSDIFGLVFLRNNAKNLLFTETNKIFITFHVCESYFSYFLLLCDCFFLFFRSDFDAWRLLFSPSVEVVNYVMTLVTWIWVPQTRAARYCINLIYPSIVLQIFSLETLLLS